MSGYPKVDDRAPCRHGDADRFFPATPGHDAKTESVKAECAGCPFRDACLGWALRHEKHGIWGGRTEQERDDIRGRLAIRLAVPHVRLERFEAAS